MWTRRAAMAVAVVTPLVLILPLIGAGQPQFEPLGSSQMAAIRGGEEEWCYYMYWEHCEPHPANCDQAVPNCVKVEGQWQCSLAGKEMYKEGTAYTQWWWCGPSQGWGYEGTVPWQQACYWLTVCPTECPFVPGVGRHCLLDGTPDTPAKLHEGCELDWNSEECFGYY